MARYGGLFEDRSLPLSADINLINLVDVAFTLLVIFMITAPILQGGVEVQIPQAEVAPLPASEAIVVSVDREGAIYIDDAQVTLDEFKAAIRDVWTQKGTPAVYVQGDENANYGIVLQVIAALKAAEIDAVGLVAEPEVRRRR
ncbi:MAG: biopolymer transporter ExbD [Gemmatimonadales bacterium]|jgi:biopolymer transport protein ExbD/biopolymer transport protein TolR